MYMVFKDIWRIRLCSTKNNQVQINEVLYKINEQESLRFFVRTIFLNLVVSIPALHRKIGILEMYDNWGDILVKYFLWHVTDQR